MLKAINQTISAPTNSRLRARHDFLESRANFDLEATLEGLPSRQQQDKQRLEFMTVADTTTFLNRVPNRIPFAQSMLLGLAKTFRANSVTLMYHSACEYSGNYVKLSSEYKCLPLLERKDMPPVFLYQFVEVVEGAVDYDQVIEEFPGLSFSQINGTFAFLRRISQFNTAGVDIDEVEQRHFAQDEELVAELRYAISQGEPSHVLTTG